MGETGEMNRMKQTRERELGTRWPVGLPLRRRLLSSPSQNPNLPVQPPWRKERQGEAERKEKRRTGKRRDRPRQVKELGRDRLDIFHVQLSTCPAIMQNGRD